MCNLFINWLDKVYKFSDNCLIVSSSINKVIDSNLYKKFYFDNQLIKTVEILKSNTIIFIDQKNNINLYSTAILKVIAYSENRILKIISKILGIFHKDIMDYLYKLIAKNRILLSRFFQIKNKCNLNYQNIVVIN